MTENIHERALQLIAQARVEGIAEADGTWLRAHVEECHFCAEHARPTDCALRFMRTAAIALPDGLAGRTQLRVRLRAEELREHEPRRRMLWFACAASWIFGVASAPYVCRLFAWLREVTRTPKLVWEIGIALLRAIPSLFAAVVLLLENARQTEDPDWMKQDS